VLGDGSEGSAILLVVMTILFFCRSAIGAKPLLVSVCFLG